jgi:hypothetical protein
MLSYYEISKELEEAGLEELEKNIYIKTSQYLAKISEEFREKVFSAVCDDIEKWTSERIDNVKRYFFDEVVNHLLGINHVYIDSDDKKKIDEYLSGIGYTAQSFRKKLFDENREVILEAITRDAMYERLKPYERYYRYWEFSDITEGYPQSSIARGFFDELISKKGFDDYMKERLSNDIIKLKEERDELSVSLKKIKYELIELGEL